jgi:transmembrane sensor
MDEKEIHDLLIKYAEGNCTPDEKALVETAYLLENSRHADELSKQEIARDLADVLTRLPQPYRQRQLWPKAVAAACMILALGAGWFLYQRSDGELKKKEIYSTLILPGKNRATLTLASGKVITLNSSKKGIVINAAQYTYDDGTQVANGNESGYQTISTPKGGQYNVVLSDGSQIMLNAATTLRFPSDFHGLAARNVELKGEAYFEIAKDKTHPFTVTSGDQKVEVLGTHFDVESYPENAEIKTTLLEGAVKVSSLKTGLTKHLMPGQQASFLANGINIKDVEAEDAIAWKNGYFMFNYETMEEAMTKIARWYDIKVEYTDPSVKNIVFFGTISKFESISKVLNMLERTKKVEFQVEGRIVKISNRSH